MSPDQSRMLFGISILVVLASLAAVFGLGHVEEKTSYGLMPIITTLATLAGGFAQWAFGPNKKMDDKDEKEKK